MPRLPRVRARRARALAVAAPRALLEVEREGAASLDRARPVGADEALDVALVVPSFRRGSGGHHTIADLVRGLEARGHQCSLWIEDDEDRHAAETAEQTAALFTTFFGPVRAPRQVGFAAWQGADVALATGWQTVHRVLRLTGVAARAYLVQDHEPDFYGASAERMWAEQTYRLGLHCVAASPWLSTLLRERYGASASHFDLGVDHATYRPRGRPREEGVLAFYARATTPRRAVPLGLLALGELHRRRPATRILLFGDNAAVIAPFPHEHLGVLDRQRLAELYSRSTLGLVLSLTNPSLVPGEMLASGLPVVDLASPSMLACFGADGPIALAAPDPLALAGVLDRLLHDPAERARRSEAGVAFVAARTWSAAAGQLEAGLRTALSDSTA
jgi:glycosyltransferase involved in cell wall biosynthesis